MIPGADLIRVCPSCGQLVRQRTWASWNTVGGVLWTDGKFEGPMVPKETAVVRCPGCRGMFIVSQAKKVGEVGETRPIVFRDPERQARHREQEELWRSARAAMVLSGVDDWRASLDAGIVRDDSDARYIRIRLWWAYNDPRRRGAKTVVDLQPDELGNLLRLRQLLVVAEPNQRLMSAEILRQLGRFAEAEALLAPPVSDHLANVRGTISELAAARIRVVRQVRPSWCRRPLGQRH